jgi:pimeloyl-ACP methyl ester carboxylesterase
MGARIVTKHVSVPDGTRIAYHTHLGEDPGATEAELRERPTVLLTSGLSTSGNYWRYVAAALEDDRRVVRWDYRGHGSSEKARSGAYGMEVEVEDFLHVCQQVMAEGDGGPPLHVGFSMGVTVLLEAYRLRPELFPAMVLVAGAPDAPGAGTPLFRFPGVTKGVRWALDALTPAVPVLAPVVHRIISSPLLYPAGRLSGVLRRRAPRSDIAQHMSAVRGMDPLAFWETLKGLMPVNASDVLPTVDVPVLIVAPAQDLMMPTSQVERMRRALPHAEYLRLEDAGHAVLVEAGPEVAGAIRDFAYRARRSALSSDPSAA